jgi:hypothetical protein
MTLGDAVITLSTSDDPPALVPVSRDALIAHSRVFADMLSLDLKSDNSDKFIPVAEKEKELWPFIGLIDSEQSQELTENMSEEEWETVGTLADKYDSQLVRTMVEAKAW